MLWPEPRSFTVDLAKGELAGTGSRYQKRFRDLDGLYADTQAFAERARSAGDEVVLRSDRSSPEHARRRPDHRRHAHVARQGRQ
ncbi:MAG: hypothetical protein QM739_01620 [Propionivibrio sp.]